MSTPIADAVEVLQACSVTPASKSNVTTLTSIVAACIQVAETPELNSEMAFRLVMRLQAQNCDADTARDMLFAATNSVAGLHEGSPSHKRVVQTLSLLESTVSARLERPLSLAS